jgi:hypothetical protein
MNTVVATVLFPSTTRAVRIQMGNLKPPNEPLKSEDCGRLHDCASNPALGGRGDGSRALSEIFQRLAGVQPRDGLGGQPGVDCVLRSRGYQAKPTGERPAGYEPGGMGGGVPVRDFHDWRLLRPGDYSDPTKASAGCRDWSSKYFSRVEFLGLGDCIGLVPDERKWTCPPDSSKIARATKAQPGCTCEEADLAVLESPMGSPLPIRELRLIFPGREATLLTPEMTTTIPPPQLSTESYDLTAVAPASANAALFQTIALTHSRVYRDHIRKLLLIGLEDTGEE